MIDFLVAITFAMAGFAVLVLIEKGIVRFQRWLEHRRLGRLPPPDDPRLRNEIMVRDWKVRRAAYARLRDAA